MGIFLAIASVFVVAALASSRKPSAAPSARLTGTSGGRVPAPGAPQVTPTEQMRVRNDFPAFSYLGGYTGGNLAPITVEPILLDPREQSLNTDLTTAHAALLQNAPQQSFGATEPQSAAQTPENFSGAPAVAVVPTKIVALQNPPLPTSWSWIPDPARPGNLTQSYLLPGPAQLSMDANIL